LFELAQAILAIVPFELEMVSKAEQGFHLLSGYTAQPLKGSVPDLAKSGSLTDGMQALIWSCLSHLQGNLHGAMDSSDAEYLHQMRVALRRLRVVLRMTEKILADEELAALRHELAELGAALGRIREWDVFIAQTVQPMCSRIEGNVGQRSLQALLDNSERQRAGCYAALRGAAQARELQRLMLRFAIWMNGPYCGRRNRVCPKRMSLLQGVCISWPNVMSRRDCTCIRWMRSTCTRCASMPRSCAMARNFSPPCTRHTRPDPICPR